MLPTTAPYRVAGLTNSSPGKRKGTLQSWKASVASFASYSHYLTFGLCCAAAAPLARFSGLPEPAVFNFVGESSVGKTTAVRTAMSAIAPPDAIRGWDLKNRALEEAAAQHNDLLLVLNGAEKMPERDRPELIVRIIHMLTEGVSTGRSVVVQDHLPDEFWTNIVLSTSNRKGPEMVATSRGWDDQDSARFIDIPVPNIEAGGIFDRVGKGSALSACCSSKLVRNLEHNMSQQYGTFLPNWITYLMASDRIAFVQCWSEIYLYLVKPTPGLEERVARKFAFVYAAGMTAVTAKLLPFQGEQVFQAVRAMHRRSVKFRTRPSDCLRKVLDVIASEFDNDAVFREVSPGEDLVINSSSRLLGVKCILDGVRVVGLRNESLEDRFGEASARAFMSWARQQGVLRHGDGNKATTQLRVRLTVQGKILTKPRFLVANERQLQKKIASFRT